MIPDIPQKYPTLSILFGLAAIIGSVKLLVEWVL